MNPRPDTADIAQTISDKADRMETKAKRATDELADRAERGVDRAREMANDTLNKAEAKVRSLREDVKPAIDAISARVQDMAARGKQAATETGERTRAKVNQVADRTTAYVQDQPLKSMAIAAAAGAVLALLLGRRRD